MYNNYLYHHGIKGQKWGVRRYQNADGSLTAEGKAKKKEKRKSVSEVCSKGRKAASVAMSKIRTIALKVFIADTVDSMMFGGAEKKAIKYTGRAAVTAALKVMGHRDIHWYD